PSPLGQSHPAPAPRGARRRDDPVLEAGSPAATGLRGVAGSARPRALLGRVVPAARSGADCRRRLRLPCRSAARAHIVYLHLLPGRQAHSHARSEAAVDALTPALTRLLHGANGFTAKSPSVTVKLACSPVAAYRMTTSHATETASMTRFRASG